jgi:hypothetical protein
MQEEPDAALFQYETEKANWLLSKYKTHENSYFDNRQSILSMLSYANIEVMVSEK